MKPVEAGFDWGMFWQAASAIATAFAAISTLANKVSKSQKG